MNWPTKFSLVLVVLSMTACANSYNRTETGGTDRTSVRLDEAIPVLVTTPKDGGYRGKISFGSGAIVARKIDASFSRYAHIVDVYPSEYHSLNELQDVIARNDYGYIVVPTINTWSRNESEWSKTPTEVSVKIVVLDAKTGKKVSSNYLEGKGASPSSFSAALDLGSDNPEELLSDLSDDYADTLYGVFLPSFGR